MVLHLSVKCTVNLYINLMVLTISVFAALKVNRIDSLVLACKLEPSAVLSGLQDIWSVIEDLTPQKRFGDVGVSDIDTDVFISLYQWAKVLYRFYPLLSW